MFSKSEQSCALIDEARGTSADSRAGLARRNISLVLAGFVVICAGLTAFDWGFPRYSENRLGFTVMGEQLLKGRFDLPEHVVGGEAIRDSEGRRYLYFGVTPALERLVLNLLFPNMRERWSPWINLAHLLVTVFFGLLLWHEFARFRPQVAGLGRSAPTEVHVGLAVLTAFGSELFFLARVPVIHHESILAGLAFFMVGCFCALRWLERPRLGWSLGLAVAAFLSIQGRPTFGIPLMLVALLLPFWWVVLRFLDARGLFRSPTSRRAEVEQVPTLSAPSSGGVLGEQRRVFIASSIVLALGLALGMTFTGKRNLALHGNALGVANYSRYPMVANSEERMKLSKGRQTLPENLLPAIRAYFSPNAIVWTDEFPFVAQAEPLNAHKAFAKRYFIQHAESSVSPLWAAPLWVFSGLLGLGLWLCALFRRRRMAYVLAPVLVATLVAAYPLFTVTMMSRRYLGDLQPAFFLFGFFAFVTLAEGWFNLAPKQRSVSAWVGLAIAVPLAALGVFVTTGTALGFTMFR